MIAAFRSPQSHEAEHLRFLLDATVVALAIPLPVEILAGASRADRQRLRRSLSALPLFYPAKTTWTRIDNWLDATGSAGERFGFGDLLIGAMAAEQDAPIWSLDHDFARMARLKLLELYRSK